MSDDTRSTPASAAPATAGGAQPASGDTFDALAAVAELDAALSANEPQVPVEQRGESYIDILESEVAALQAQVEQTTRELRAAEDELETSIARVEQAAEQRVEQRTRKILIEFLEVLDNLDRALVSAQEVDHNPAVVDGVELVRKSFISKLASFGVEHDPSMGEEFDPNLHDAISVTPTQDADSDGKVVAVIHEGYTIGDEVLRPAGVIVGKKAG